MLARHPRQECIWSSYSAWKVGKFVLQHEESGVEATPRESSDIPADRRISEARFDFSDKSTEEASKGRVGYRAAVVRATP